MPILTCYGPQKQRYAQEFRRLIGQCVVKAGEGHGDGIEICLGTQCLAQRLPFKEALGVVSKILRKES
jgi:hypothetical protein